MQRNCDLCSAPPTDYLKQDERIAICQHCGFLYVPERRTPEEIARGWDHVWDGGYDPDWPGVKARLYYVATWLENRLGLNGRSLLDIGSGKGNFMKMAEQRGATVTGIEPSPHNASRRPNVIAGTIETAPLEGQRFDIVTIMWTLENCGDCIGMLEYARRHLTPGGYVIVATGSRILVPFKKPLYKYLPAPDVPADLHSFRFSINSLRRAMVKAGLEPFLVNDYDENDVMIVAGREPDPNKTPVLRDDDPQEVQDFFDNWERLFA